jgi:hypothetical protein
MKKFCLLLAGAFLLTAGACAQIVTAPAPPGAPGAMMFFQSGSAGPGGAVTTYNYNYVFATNVGDRELVKGVPYSATAVTESTQVLGDGNRIVNKSSAFLARDGEGRTRHELTMGIGPLPPDANKTVMINDPVSKTDYILNAKEQTANVLSHSDPMMREHKIIMSGQEQKESTEAGQKIETEQKIMMADQKVKVYKQARAIGTGFNAEFSGEVKHEDLGTQVIEGVSCTGIRETRTIAAGAIGNERPIEITSETWMSPELKMVVLSKHSDPRFGETTYHLTDIRRSEPDPSLFQVPGDYKIVAPQDRKVIVERGTTSPKE